jgi:hypothetical protein
MSVPTLEVGYTSATTGRGDYEVRKGHVVALEEEEEEEKKKQKKKREEEEKEGKQSLILAFASVTTDAHSVPALHRCMPIFLKSSSTSSIHLNVELL